MELRGPDETQRVVTPGVSRWERAKRAMSAAVVGLIAGTIIGSLLAHAPGLYAADFTGVWRAAGQLLHGTNPYSSVESGLPYPLGPLAYPLPAVLVALPLGQLSAAAAGGVFIGLGIGLLVFAILETAPHRLFLFASPSFVMAMSLVQWSPLLTAAGMLAPLGIFAACKPNLGLALLARRPNRWIVFGGAALLALSFLVVPSWVGDWLGGVRRMSYYQAPIAVPGGFLLLLAALRWRDPDARMLLVLSVLPANLILYDQLPLFLVARSRRQTLLLVAGSWLATFVTRAVTPPSVLDEAAAQTFMREPVVAFMFLPALYLVLARPASGGQPDLVDRVLNRRIRMQRGRLGPGPLAAAER